MTERCPVCGLSQQRIRTPDGGEAWLCVNCNDHTFIDATRAVRDALELDKRVDFDAVTCAFAFGIAETLTDTPGVGSKHPDVIAASCLYLGSILARATLDDGEKLTQPELADAAGVSEISIRKTYRELYEASGYADAYGEIRQGRIDPGDPHPAIDVEGWRDHLEAQGNARETVKNDVSIVRRFAMWYDGADAEPPDSGDVAAWLAQLAGEGFASATIEGRYETLQQYFKWADLGELRARSRVETGP